MIIVQSMASTNRRGQMMSERYSITCSRCHGTGKVREKAPRREQQTTTGKLYRDVECRHCDGKGWVERKTGNG